MKLSRDQQKGKKARLTGNSQFPALGCLQILELVCRNSVKPKKPLKELQKLTQKIHLVRSLSGTD